MGQGMLSSPTDPPTHLYVHIGAEVLCLQLPREAVTSGWILSECLRKYQGPGKVVALRGSQESDVVDVLLQSFARPCDYLTEGAHLAGIFERAVYPPVTQHHFSYLQVIGRGGLSTVLKARKHDSGSLYAVKVMRKADVLKTGKVPQVFTELSILSKVKHPFIVQLHYAFQSVRGK